METAYRKQYTTPNIESIFLDSHISLQLESTPPNGPDETFWLNDKNIEMNPFKMNV